MIHRLTYSGGAQTVRTIVMRDDGRPVVPASATYAVVDLRYGADDAAHEVETGSAAVDSVSTTTSAACGRGTADPRALTVASATGITAGRRYLLSYGGRAEEVRVAAVSGTTIRLSNAVTQSFASNATFVGLEISATVTSDTCADDKFLSSPNSLAIRWTPLGHQPFLEQLHLERLQPAPLVAPDEVLNMDPTLAAYADESMSAADALREAFTDFKVDLGVHDIDDDEILAGPIGRDAVRYRAAWHLIKHSTEESAVRRADRYDGRYQNLVANLVQGAQKKKVALLTQDAAKAPEDVRSRFALRW